MTLHAAGACMCVSLSQDLSHAAGTTRCGGHTCAHKHVMQCSRASVNSGTCQYSDQAPNRRNSKASVRSSRQWQAGSALAHRSRRRWAFMLNFRCVEQRAIAAAFRPTCTRQGALRRAIVSGLGLRMRRAPAGPPHCDRCTGTFSGQSDGMQHAATT